MSIRTLIAVMVFAIAGFGASTSADAAREACVAAVTIGAVSMPAADHDQPIGPARLFAFQLSAGKDRIVSGNLVLDTDRGWFVAPFSRSHIAAVQRRFTWSYGDFTKTSWESNVMYVDAGAPVSVKHYFLDALTTPDITAPHATRCYNTYGVKVPSLRQPQVAPPRTVDALPRMLDRADLTASPTAGTATIAAKPSPPLASAACADPFLNARGFDFHYPAYPMRAPDMGIVHGTTLVDVYIDENGAPRDAWIDRSSGLFEFDASTLQAAQQTSYKPAIAYCIPIPTVYIFRADFDQNL